MSTSRFPILTVLALAMAGLPTAASGQELVPDGGQPAPVVGVEPATPAPGTDGVEGPPAPGQAPARPAPVSPLTPDGFKDPGSGIELQGLMRMLYGAMRGQRVIAVSQPNNWRSNDLTGPDYQHARTLIEKLQVIAASQSNDTESSSPWNVIQIPFKVGNAYAIAPETREGVNADLRGYSVLDVSSRGTLLLDVLLQLTPKQVTDLGSEAGLPVSSLPREQQAMLVRSFRPSLKIVNVRPSTYTDENGMVRPSWEHHDSGRLDEPLDFSHARIRATIRINGVNVQLGHTGTMLGYRGNEEGPMFSPADDRFQSYSDYGANLPIYQEVPNTYKPSDLEGRRFTAPIGMSGVWKVEDVVKQLSRATGLKMQAWPHYRDRQVFIGAPEITSGEVMDALRLCLTASWRKLGDTYLLAWDRMPLQAIQLLARETSESAAVQVRKRRVQMEADPGWLRLVRNLPFAPDDPLALTPEQRNRLFPTELDPKQGRGYRDISIPFTEMTPEQQSYIRKKSEEDSIDLPEMGPENPAIKRPYTEEDVRSSTMQPQGSIIVSINVPGHGWVRAGDHWDSLGFHGWQLQRAINKASEQEPRDILDDAPPEVRQMLADMKPMALPSATRAAIVPVLGPARLNELADEMKHRGLNVLFYPALYGGYATFTSKAFPLHPALRGEDGFSAAVAAMKPKGIRVVGYLNTLAWQNASDKVHWLSKYPQWQDVDVLGRTRIQWIAANPESVGAVDAFGMSLSGYVRPTEPMVEARLKALLVEFAAKRDASGVAFAEWAPSGLSEFMPGRRKAPPALGFSLADRIAAFQKTGQDPADKVSWSDHVPATLRNEPGFMENEPNQEYNLQAHKALVARLLDDAKARRKDWTTYLMEDGSFGRRPSMPGQEKPGEAVPKPDLRIRSLFTFMESQGNTSGLLFPIAKRNFFAAMSEVEEIASTETIPKQLLELPSLAVYNLIWSTERNMKSLTMPLIALDFRSAPEAITETMRWIQPPGAPAAPGAKPAVGPAARPGTPPAPTTGVVVETKRVPTVR